MGTKSTDKWLTSVPDDYIWVDSSRYKKNAPLWGGEYKKRTVFAEGSPLDIDLKRVGISVESRDLLRSGNMLPREVAKEWGSIIKRRRSQLCLNLPRRAYRNPEEEALAKDRASLEALSNATADDKGNKIPTALIRAMEAGMLLPSADDLARLRKGLNLNRNDDLVKSINNGFCELYYMAAAPSFGWANMLTERRLELRLSESDLARELGVNADIVRSWEYARAIPDQEQFALLCTLLDWDLHEHEQPVDDKRNLFVAMYEHQCNEFKHNRPKAVAVRAANKENPLAQSSTSLPTERGEDLAQDEIESEDAKRTSDGATIYEEIPYSANPHQLHELAEQTQNFAQFLGCLAVSNYLNQEKGNDLPALAALEAPHVEYRGWLGSGRINGLRQLPLQRTLEYIAAHLGLEYNTQKFIAPGGDGQETAAEKLVRLHLGLAHDKITSSDEWPGKFLPSAYGKQIMNEAKTLTGYLRGCPLSLGKNFIDVAPIRGFEVDKNWKFSVHEKIEFVRRFLKQEGIYDENRFEPLVEDFLKLPPGFKQDWRSDIAEIHPSKETIKAATADLIERARKHAHLYEKEEDFGLFLDGLEGDGSPQIVQRRGNGGFGSSEAQQVLVLFEEAKAKARAANGCDEAAGNGAGHDGNGSSQNGNGVHPHGNGTGNGSNGGVAAEILGRKDRNWAEVTRAAQNAAGGFARGGGGDGRNVRGSLVQHDKPGD